MLQLVTKETDIVKVSKLLAKYNITASISNGIINVSGEIPEELINVLCSEIDILSVEKNDAEIADNNSEILYRGDYRIIDKTANYDLKFPVVKRGEIYLCDCGNGYGAELMGMRMALIVQNDIANTYSPTTIIIPITSKVSRYPNTHTISFSEKTLVDFSSSISGKYKTATFLCAQIRVADKKRLRDYVGTLNGEVLEQIERKVKDALQLNGETT